MGRAVACSRVVRVEQQVGMRSPGQAEGLVGLSLNRRSLRGRAAVLACRIDAKGDQHVA